jgi:3-dehydroquinate synthase
MNKAIAIKKIIVKPGKGRDYPIIIGANILPQLGNYLQESNFGKKVVIITNPKIKKLYSTPIIQSLKKQNINVHIITVPDGESSKNLKEVSKIIDKLLDLRLERKDTLIALGGGVIGDLCGFVASIYLRGINLIQVPTTLLAQVDSSVGGKTGVNHEKGKNLIGAFYQPNMTYIDLDVLKTLPKREVLCGLAEIVKYGVICNKKLFWFMEKNIDKINKHNFEQDREIWEYLIERSCINKAKVVSIDEKETGLREILNFGHTIGHGIEAVFKYKRYLHGEAVALGMRTATMIAYRMNMIDKSLMLRINSLLTHLNFPNYIDKTSVDDIVAKLILDKKVRNGKVRFVLPTTLGEVVVRDDIPPEIIKKVITLITK